jgi:hypothetical protein
MRKTIGFSLAALVAIAIAWRLTRRSAPELPPARAPAVAAPHAAGAPARPSLDSQARDAGEDVSITRPPPGLASAGAPDDPVDLNRLRARLPDNLYWTLGAPTDDPAVLAARRERERRTNELYGKVQSTTATEEEIERYYAERRRVSEDYIRFAELVLAEYRDQLPEEHIGLYELSIRMHRARLDDNPRERQEALDRLRARRQRR